MIGLQYSTATKKSQLLILKFFIMKKLLYVALIGLMLLAACSKSSQEEDQLTFADIEKEFGFDKPLSELGRDLVLERYGSLKDYRSHLISLHKLKSDSIQRKTKSIIDFKIDIDVENGSYTSCFIGYDDWTLLESAEENGIDLPYSCRAGACSTCTGKLTRGFVRQDDQSFLSPEAVEAGFILTCVAYPDSDLHFISDQELELWLFEY